MDKFESLKLDIQKTAEALTIKRMRKENELEGLKETQVELVNNQNRILEKHKVVASNLDTLKYYENKNIIISILKEAILRLIQDLKTDIKENKLSIIVLLAFMSLAILEPTFAAILLISILSMLSIASIIFISRDILRLRKKYSISQLEKEKRELEDELLILLANISEKDREISNITAEIDSLKERIKKLREDYETITYAKNEVLKQVVSEKILNQAFKEPVFSDIIKRTREKKEGE